MFQRLKGAIDSRIAEEQARQKASQSSPSRSSSSARQARIRTASPSTQSSRTREVGQDDQGNFSNQANPSDFEKALADDAEDGSPRTEAPKPEKVEPDEVSDNLHVSPEKASAAVDAEPKEASPANIEAQKQPDLPVDVQLRLRRLEKLEAKYKELLRSYRAAHSRVSLVEKFETSLREHTPLTSVNEPAAFVEYLNQVNLKSDMVMNELKRVTGERDDFRQKLDDARESAKEAWDEVGKLRNEETSISKTAYLPSTDESGEQTLSEVNSLTQKTNKRQAPSDPPLSTPQQDTGTSEENESREDFFSYDEELPRLRSELHNSIERIELLNSERETLRNDLAVARESTEGMVQSLEQATRELQGLRDQKDQMEQQHRELEEQHTSAESNVRRLEQQLGLAETELQALKLQRNEQPEEGSQKQRLQEQVKSLSADIANCRDVISEYKSRVQTLDGLAESLGLQLKSAQDEKASVVEELKLKSNAAQKLADSVKRLEDDINLQAQSRDYPARDDSAEIASSDQLKSSIVETPGNVLTSSGKKKGKRKKKAPKVGANTNGVVEQDGSANKQEQLKFEIPDPDIAPPRSSSPVVDALQKELMLLHRLLEEKDLELGQLIKKRKNEENLQEEIDTLRENLIDVGQNCVASRDQVKQLEMDKTALEERVRSLEEEIAQSGTSHASVTAASKEALEVLNRDFGDLKSTAATLQTDLLAAQQLAASRFKDLTTLKEILHKAQPELTSLRSEVANLKSVREELNVKAARLTELDSKERDMSLQMSGLKTQLSERSADIQKLSGRLKQETAGRTTAEAALEATLRSSRTTEEEKKKLLDAREATAKELEKLQQEVSTYKMKVRELELQRSTMEQNMQNLREEIELKTAQHASAQSLMGSMRDQTSEIGAQMKEARERCESLEEELGDAHRLLSERSRESETMRRLLVDVEARADSKVREMRERMETAIEERDRAEDEVSTVGRKRGREVEELKSKVRTAERDVRAAEEERQELASAQIQWKAKRQELESLIEKSAKEVDDVRHAMGELRDALDESEKQASALEKQKTELRHELQDRQDRLDKFRSSYKSISEENRTMKAGRPRPSVSQAPSSRSSFESSPLGRRLASPPANAGHPTLYTAQSANGSIDSKPGSVDHVYLKNVLLQFLEQRDKNHQLQLIPVLGMLLNFDRKDEQRWMAAITAK